MDKMPVDVYDTPKKEISWLEMCENSQSPEKYRTESCLPHTCLETTPDKATTSNNKANERKIEIEIFEEQNEKKFDRLVQEEKLKSPFKRRLSEHSDKSGNGNSPELDTKRTKKEQLQGDERTRCESTSSSGSGQNVKRKKEYETDQATISRREKQIEFGKNTLGYDNYLKAMPKETRTREQPQTPDKNLKYSRRAWDGLIKIWRKGLHVYDPKNDGSEDESSTSKGDE